MVNADGEVHLLDLGVAKDLYQSEETQKEDSGKIRRYLSPLKETSKEDIGKAQAKNAPQSTMVLRNGFRALEQYQTNGEIGPWTDVYAMTATMYYLLSGKDLPTPMDRLDSEKEKTVQNVINSLEIPEKTKEGMRKGLAVLKKDRIGTMRELLEYCSEEPVPIAASPSKRRRKWPIFLFPRATSQVAMLAWIFGDCREGQIPRCLQRCKFDTPLLAAGSLIGSCGNRRRSLCGEGRLPFNQKRGAVLRRRKLRGGAGSVSGSRRHGKCGTCASGGI